MTTPSKTRRVRKTISERMMGNRYAAKDYKPPQHIRKAQIINQLAALVVELGRAMEADGEFEFSPTKRSKTKKV